MRPTPFVRAALAAALALTLGGLAAPARAAELTVTRTDDTLTCTPGDRSLRGAIIEANKAYRCGRDVYVLVIDPARSSDDRAVFGVWSGMVW